MVITCSVERRFLPINTLIAIAKVLSYINREIWLPYAHQFFFSKTKFNRRSHMITTNSAIANKGYLQYQPQSELLQFVHHRFVPEKEVVT